MSDYIKREDAIKAIKKDIMGGLNYESILNRLPSTDAVEVVRCRDCECCEVRRTVNCMPFYYCLRIDSSVKDNDYCSYGERKGARE